MQAGIKLSGCTQHQKPNFKFISVYYGVIMGVPEDIRSTFQLESFFSSIGNEVKGQRGSLVKDGKGYQVIYVDKHSFSFLRFREIVDIANSFKEQLAENPLRSNKIAKELTVMKERKIEKESKQFLFLKLIFKIVQIVRNFFKGHGFCSDVGYAEKVIKKLELSLPTEEPDELIEKQETVLPTRTRRERFTSKRKSTVGKKSAIDAFKRDPGNCSSFHKTILFRDIKSVKDLEDLICTVSNTETVDLNNQWSKILILEALDAVQREVSDVIIEELTKKGFFTPHIYCDILKQITDKADEQKPFSLFSLELLMKLYMEKDWYLGNLPLDNPQFLKGFQLLIKSKPNENPTVQMVDWMLTLPQFNFAVCVACITSYLKKIWEKPPQQQVNIVYPVLQKLEDHFKTKGWAAQADTVQHTAVKRHLESLGGNV